MQDTAQPNAFVDVIRFTVTPMATSDQRWAGRFNEREDGYTANPMPVTGHAPSREIQIRCAPGRTVALSLCQGFLEPVDGMIANPTPEQIALIQILTGYSLVRGVKETRESVPRAA